MTIVYNKNGKRTICNRISKINFGTQQVEVLHYNTAKYKQGDYYSEQIIPLVDIIAICSQHKVAVCKK